TIYACSEPGQQGIIDAIHEHKLTGVVVASCTPRMHEPTFRKAVERAGLNRYMFEMANIREHVSWIGKDLNANTNKAAELVRIAVAKLRLNHKCRRCKYPNAVFSDTFVGTPANPPAGEDNYADLAAFEALPLEERMAFWEKEMSRCIRCYACRNACPLCVCRDHCIATSREPQWVTQADGIKDKLFFQIIHATHLAGRCTGCGECQRACPVGIPVLLLKRSLSRSVEALFEYQAGVDPKATPPLQTFTIEEPRIKERDW
ncbi:hypothetical protein B566_EDAN019422, partial [Ephemera danica]